MGNGRAVLPTGICDGNRPYRLAAGNILAGICEDVCPTWIVPGRGWESSGGDVQDGGKGRGVADGLETEALPLGEGPTPAPIFLF
jgi:hypothetical protein